ncbi:MAG: hypothetical protein EA000_07750 [Oscillatoriales cyanobacterium]|nr:MAG: hypothetical protein EA000_07750 [Oscillatoriales cyanobacterium]
MVNTGKHLDALQEVKIVATMIQDLFNGSLADFLRESAIIPIAIFESYAILGTAFIMPDTKRVCQN